MKRILCATVFLCFFLSTSTILGMTISLDPDDQYIAPGGTASVDLNISGLGNGATPSLGAFSLNLLFDSSVLGFGSVSFGPFLGDPALFEADTFVDASLPGTIYLDEISFLFDFELDALQPASFTLASFEFTGLGKGESPLTLSSVVLSDAYGFILTDPTILNAEIGVGVNDNVGAVPLPPSLLLFGTGLVGLIGLKRKTIETS